MEPSEGSAYRIRLRKRLGVIVDDVQPEFIRLAAIKVVQKMLDDRNPLKHERAKSLLDRMLQPWDSRLYVISGRGVLRRVCRPPAGLPDVWK